MNYITITSNSVSKRYYAINYSPFMSSPRTARQLIGGGYDTVFGATYYGANYTLRITHTPEDTNFGSLADIQALYAKTDPDVPSSSPFFTVVDHTSTSRTAFIQDPEMSFQLITTVVSGTYAYYIVNIRMLFT